MTIPSKSARGATHAAGKIANTISYGFPGAPEAFTGTPDQHAYHQRILGQKIEYMKKHKLPIWNGEFGPVYANPADGPDWEKTNESRYGVLKYQLSLYQEQNISWSIWLWKGGSSAQTAGPRR
jgi:aryl-phospho-beta-D-glucosidase BglC (GH1 family)